MPYSAQIDGRRPSRGEELSLRHEHVFKTKEGTQTIQAEGGIETSCSECNGFLARTTSKDYTARLLYYAIAVCIYNSWCVFNARSEDGRATDLELKVSVLLLAMVSSKLDQPQTTNDHG